MTISRLAALLIVVVAALALSGAARGTEMRVVGTDLLGSEFSRAAYAMAGKQGISLALALDGSRPAIEALRTGRADAALVLLPREEGEALAGFENIIVGYHAVVVLVPAGCPLERITLAQLAGIFGARPSARVKTWGELGVSGDWSASPIAALAPVTGTGVELELFRDLVLARGDVIPTVARYRTTAELGAAFAGDGRTMALTSFAHARTAPGARPLAVAAKNPGAAVRPTAEALHAGEYPLRLALRFVASPERKATIRPLREWLSGDEGAAVLERAGLAPVPREMRVGRRFDAEKPWVCDGRK